MHSSQFHGGASTGQSSAPRDKDEVAHRRKEIKERIRRTEQRIVKLRSKLPSQKVIASDLIKFLRRAYQRNIKASLEAECKVLQSLKYQHNELVPIYQLPGEVLLHIFVLCASSSQRPFRLSTTSAGYLSTDGFDWIYVTHVSHKWREVAITSPSLWSHITPSRPPWTFLMLERSRPVPISVKADFLDLSIQGVKATPTVLRELSRIRELTLVIPELGALQEALSRPAPILDSLTLRVYHRQSALCLPDSLFASTAPRLRQMSLDNCYLPWDSPLFKHLTHLRLVNLEMNVSMSQFLDTLRGMPFLQDLSLRRAIPNLPRGNRDASTPIPPVIFDHLSVFYLNGPTANCANLLNHLMLPTLPFLEFVFEIRNPTAEPTQGIISAVARHCGKAGGEKAYHRFSLEKVLSSGFRIQSWSIAHGRTLSRLSLLLTSRGTAWHDELSARVAADIFSLFPLRWVQSLQVNVDVGMAWLNASPALNGVEALELDQDAVRGWLSAQFEGDMASVIEPILFPVLRRVEIRDAMEGTQYHLLYKLFKWRETLGSRVQSLLFRRCAGLTDDEVGKFKEIIPDFERVEEQLPMNIEEETPPIVGTTPASGR